MHAQNDLEHKSISAKTKFENISIYDIRSHAKQKMLLAIVSIVAGLLPFCDTIYLPSLEIIELDLHTTATLVAISVSIYLFMNGLFSVVWGPLSDRFGRKRIMIVALIIFVAVSIVCIFSPTVAVLITFRAIQGAAVSATLVVGQGAVADIYPPVHRGWATGIFFVPVLVGPVIGPLIGGALSDRFGWRSTFILLTILSFFFVIGIAILLPETQHYFAMRRFERKQSDKRIQDDERQTKPTFRKPLQPFKFLLDMTILPYAIVATTTFAGLFVSLTLFSSYLSQEPYLKGETIIGVLFVPAGVTMLVGSLLGGWLSDKAGSYYTNECPEGRLVPAIIFSIFTPIGLLIYGWAFHYRTHLAVGIIGQIILSFGQSVHQPGVFAYLTAKKQKDAAAASAANSVLNFCGAAAGVTAAVPLQNAMGTGPFYSFLAGLNILAILVASILVIRQIRAGSSARQSVAKEGKINPLPISTILEDTTVGENRIQQQSRNYIDDNQF